ncbi:hypothetical protein [Kitasatospora purpeofusca]|uniref:hypothetical protein n=1 Tax=Kitasatospora purpeofusca TaxID=67352 RepID=UPI00386DD746|nr:MVB12 family protein [Kitasatospora purpeofusca]
MTTYVTNLMVLKSRDEQPPPGWHRSPFDLNDGAGGKYLYFAWEYSEKDDPITDIYFAQGKDAQPPSGYTKYPVDLNDGASGEYIYACFTTDPTKGKPITDLQVIDHTEPESAPEGFSRIEPDLNKGAGGKYIYLCRKPEA